MVQADHRLYSAEQLARHEIMHAKLTDDPAMREDIVSAIVSRFDRQEIQNITARYANGYGFIYGVETESMTADELMALDMQYLEEFICDAYAGINRAFMGSGSTAARYGEIVTDIAESRIGMGNGSGGMPGARYSVRPEFEEEFWTWYNSTNEAQRTADGGWFRVGQTSDALKSIGVRDSDIYWRKSKVGYILQEHVEMTPKLLVQVPQIIEDPLIVMKSRTQADSITLFAELAAEKRPVMAAINLKPIPTGGMEAEFVLIASAYSRSVESARNLIKNSEILYLNADKKRTEAWLMSLGLQLPSGQPAYGSVGNISYADGGVKIQGVQYSEWVKGTDEEFGGLKLRSNYPDLTAYDRYLSSRNKETPEVGQEAVAEPNDARYSTDDDAGKAPEEMTAAELRRAMSARERRNTTPDLGWDRAVFAGGDAVTSSDERPAYEEWEVEAALYDALDHGNPAHENVIRLGQMPRYIQKLLGVEGDMYIYRDHAYENMVTRERAIEDGRPVKRRGSDIRFHGHGVERMTDAIMALEHPVMTIAGRGNRDGNPVITMLLDVEGSNGAPLYAVVGLYSNEGINGRFNEKPHILVTIAERDIEKVTPGEGRDSYEEVIRNAIENGRLIDYDKTKRATLSVIAKQARLGNITEDALNANLAQFRKEVKGYERQIGVQRSSDSLRFSMDDAGKAPEEMTAAELRRAIKGDQSMLEAYARIERASGLTPEVRNERDAVASRLVKERELLKEKNEQFAAEKQDARERARARTVPTRAKADFRKEMLDIFSTQMGMRQELGTLVDRFAEDTLSRGAISYQDRARLIIKQPA